MVHTTNGGPWQGKKGNCHGAPWAAGPVGRRERWEGVSPGRPVMLRGGRGLEGRRLDGTGNRFVAEEGPARQFAGYGWERGGRDLRGQGSVGAGICGGRDP